MRGLSKEQQFHVSMTCPFGFESRAFFVDVSLLRFVAVPYHFFPLWPQFGGAWTSMFIRFHLYLGPRRRWVICVQFEGYVGDVRDFRRVDLNRDVLVLAVEESHRSRAGIVSWN